MDIPSVLATGFSLPDVGVDVASGVTALITLVGGVALVAVGGALAFAGIKAGVRWARRAFG